VSRFNGNRTPSDNNDTAGPDSGGTAERRRLGRVVHDDRGSASVEWRDAPADYERPVFQVAGTGVQDPLAVKNDDTFNPYDRTPDSSPTNTGKNGKRDLKKLSAWLKLMREIEERKTRGEE
jgi:hypothetical protein